MSVPPLNFTIPMFGSLTDSKISFLLALPNDPAGYRLPLRDICWIRLLIESCFFKEVIWT